MRIRCNNNSTRSAEQAQDKATIARLSSKIYWTEFERDTARAELAVALEAAAQGVVLSDLQRMSRACEMLYPLGVHLTLIDGVWEYVIEV